MPKKITPRTVFDTDNIRSLQRYAKHKNPFIRAAVGMKRIHLNSFDDSSSLRKRAHLQAILHRLAKDPDIKVRASVAGNKDILLLTLVYIFIRTDINDDHNWSIFISLAENESSTDQMIENIYRVRHKWSECLAIVNRKHPPTELLKKAASDEGKKDDGGDWGKIQEIAQGRLSH